MKRVLLGVLYVLALLPFPRSRRCTVFLYHSISSSQDFFSVSRDEFKKQLSSIQAHADLVPLSEVPDFITMGALEREKRYTRDIVAITFDDGYRDFIDAALPELIEAGCPATVFVMGGEPDRRELGNTHPLLDPSCKEALSHPLVTVGSHAVTHRKLPRLSPDELRSELVGSRMYIEETYGIRPTVLAYPKGSWNERVAQSAKESGYTSAYTVQNRGVWPTDDLLSIPRIQIDSTSSLFDIRAKMTVAADWYQALWALKSKVSRFLKK